MAAMTRPVKRLYDLEIDEISLVDRPANQHGLVAIAKRDGEDMPEIYYGDGQPANEDSLEHGDVVYDEAGNEYVYVEEGEDGSTAEVQSGHNYEAEPERELSLVGKSLKGFGSLDRAAKFRAGRELAGNKGVRRGAAIGAGGAAAGLAAGSVGKGLGESVYEALSKALNDGDRDQVVSKLAEEVEVTKAENDELREIVASILSDREDSQFVELAKGYNLPIAPERLGAILKNAAATLDDEDLAELDRLLTAQGEMYEELGTNGSQSTSTILDQVQAMALETVGKADVTVEQATVALFEANPGAYDDYLQEG